MNDFVSQGTLDTGLVLPPDALGHEPLAKAIIHKAVHLPPGSVIAVQGSWGRGKTDVLARVALAVRDPKAHKLPSDVACEVLWINPWQYGTPDLLTPLVIGLLQRIPRERRSGDKALRKAAETIIRAGINFGLKLGALAIPAAPLLELAADPLDRLIGGLFEAVNQQQPAEALPDSDPVAVMGERFKVLVEGLVSSKRMAAGARVIVCVDDLDRCLPDRQVALLEAIRFLISSDAPATFLIALDPTLARQAILTHYKTEAFDPDRYLDKMFHLRVNLPAIGTQVQELVKRHLAREVRAFGDRLQLGQLVQHLFGSDGAPKRLSDAAARALCVPDLSSPRVLTRIFDRLYLLALTAEVKGRLPLQSEDDYVLLLLWLGLVERWPDVRFALQDGGPDDFADRLARLILAHKNADPKPIGIAALDRLPRPSAALELSQVMRLIRPDRAALLLQIDQALVAAGL